MRERNGMEGWRSLVTRVQKADCFSQRFRQYRRDIAALTLWLNLVVHFILDTGLVQRSP
jgi:hypothetical protein